jgi:hypothetical protein
MRFTPVLHRTVTLMSNPASTLKLLLKWQRGKYTDSHLTKPDFSATLPLKATRDVTAWKVARILDPYTSSFGGVNYGKFTLDDLAVCTKDKHSAPQVWCSCGFYAYEESERAHHLWKQRWGSVLLRVEMYGTVIVHTKGLRAAQQSILGVYLPGSCEALLCRKPSVGLLTSHKQWYAVCGNHFREKGLSLEQLRNLWGVDVTIGAPSL